MHAADSQDATRVAKHQHWQVAADQTRQQKLAMYMTHILTVAAGEPAYEAHIQQLLDKIQSAHNDIEAAKRALLHLVTDPAGCGSPPQELHTCAVQLTAEFLDPGVSGGEEEEKEHTSRTAKERETHQAPKMCSKKVEPDE